MVRRLRVEFVILAVLLGIAPMGLAADHRAVVSGVIRDAKGVPQMGALVQILSPDASVRASAFTDLEGRYLVRSLLPGLYGIRATAALFLPASRDNLRLQPDRRAVVDLTLRGSLHESAWLPAKAKGADELSDDWNWTLRSSANRPILKLEDEDGVLVAGSGAGERSPAERVHARATLTSSSRSFGGGAAGLSVSAEKIHSHQSRTVFRASAGPAGSPALGSSPEGGSMPVGLSTTLERRMGFAGLLSSKIQYDSRPEIVGPGGGAGLKVITISSAERFGVGDLAEIEAGSRVQATSGPASAIVTRPFFRVSVHPQPWWTVTYDLATSRDNQDYDAATWRDADLPMAVAGADGRVETEKGLHQEVSLSRTTASTTFSIAYFTDVLDRIALSGVGDQRGADPIAEQAALLHSGGSDMDGLLRDRSSGSFEALHAGYQDSGFNVLVTQALGHGTWVALQYCNGSALAASAGRPGALAGGLPPLETRRSQAATASVKARLARTGTKVRVAYRWQPELLVTSVDPYDVLAGGDFLSLHLQQPVSLAGFLPAGMVLTVDGANLLSQGYQGFSAKSGTPLYLASSPFGLQAGLAFSF